MVINGELGWGGDLFDWLGCRFKGSWGQQRLEGQWTSAFSYGADCTFQLSNQWEIDLGYAFTNVVGQGGSSAFNNRALSGQIRATF